VAHALLSVYTVDGKKVADYNVAAGSVQRTIDVAEFKAGVYFLVYRNNKQTITSSFVK
jgi:hypothetical protein